jgi:hypothetical protein
MKLRLEGIGKIKEAEVIMDGITVICGGNDTGKGLVGRILFCLYHNLSGSGIDGTFRYDLYGRIFAILRGSGKSGNTALEATWARTESNRIVKNMEWYKVGVGIEELGVVIRNRFPECDISRVVDVLNIPKELVLNNLVMGEIERETWNGMGPDGKIFLDTPDGGIEIYKSHALPNRYGELGKAGIFLCNVLQLGRIIDLWWEYKESDFGVSDGEREIREKIFSVCGDYRDIPKTYLTDKVLTGEKIFMALDTLIRAKRVEKRFLYLDGLDGSLHPEWQILLAEVLVLMRKEYLMNILIDTHSHYFLDAIDVYSKKYGVSDKCKYYLAEIVDGVSTMTDVLEADVDLKRMYDGFARPLQVLECERYGVGMEYE